MTAVRVQFGVLGPLSVQVGSEFRAVAAPRLRSLLAALLLRANATVSAGDLVEIVWDENPPPKARGTLQSYVMRLRRGLGEGLETRVVTRPGGYQIDVAAGELDVRRFEDLFRAGCASANAGRWERCGADLRAALGLWRGEPLADVPSDCLLRTEGIRLSEMRLQAMEWRIQADLHLGRHDEVVGELRRLVTEFPLRERLWESLLLALYRSGQQAAALTAYQDVRQFLAGQLAVEPGAELRRLHQQILAADPGLLTTSADRGPRVTCRRRVPRMVPRRPAPCLRLPQTAPAQPPGPQR